MGFLRASAAAAGAETGNVTAVSRRSSFAVCQYQHKALLLMSILRARSLLCPRPPLPFLSCADFLSCRFLFASAGVGICVVNYQLRTPIRLDDSFLEELEMLIVLLARHISEVSCCHCCYASLPVVARQMRK